MVWCACRFEEGGFSLGRDYDPDRVRAEERKLKRQVAKEKRGMSACCRVDVYLCGCVGVCVCVWWARSTN